MLLKRLAIAGVRNLQEARLDELQQVNVIHGRNGSGKTSVLEAIHVLGVSRSFRSQKMQAVINHDMDAALVWGDVSNLQADGPLHRLGVQRHRKQRPLVKVDGEKVFSLLDLAGLLPLQLINSDSFKLLEGPPLLRRQLLDWGVFHVKHSGFYDAWRCYNRALKQRNSLLRRGKIDKNLLAGWDRELIQHGQILHELRADQFEALLKGFTSVHQWLLSELPEELPEQDLEFEYFPGWSRDRDLSEVISEALDKDREQGFTRQGPHRADIRIRLNGQPASDVMSRGQLKTVVCAIRIAQAMLLQECGINSVFLIDDLPAELDADRRAAITKKLIAMGLQIFVTTIDAQELDHCWGEAPTPIKRFHVEHGRIAPD